MYHNIHPTAPKYGLDLFLIKNVFVWVKKYDMRTKTMYL